MSSKSFHSPSMNACVISIVVPVYNEDGILCELYDKLSHALEKISVSYEIIFVDDGSSDRSLAALKGFHEINPRVKVISFERNYGQHLALLAGIEHSRGRYITTIDADLQNDPADIIRLLAKINEGYDVVKGRRVLRKTKMSRRFYSFMANKVLKILINKNINDYGCALGIYKRELFDSILSKGKLPKYIFYFVFRSGATITEIPVEEYKRRSSGSKYNFFKLLKTFTELVMTFLIYSKWGYKFFTMSLVISYTALGIIALLIFLILFGFSSWPINIAMLVVLLLLGAGQLVSHAMIRKHIMEYEREFSDKPLYTIKEALC